MSNLKCLLPIALLGAAACGDSSSTQPDAAHQVQVDAAAPDAPPAQDACARLGLTPVALRTDLAWAGTNRADLTAWLDAAGCASPGYAPAHKPVVTLDWDNTISKNDFGDAITFWLIAHDKVKQPPGKDWHATSQFMTDAAATALSTACDGLAAAGEPLPTSTSAACADEILSVYIDGVTKVGGLAAFAGWNYRRVEPTYAWTAQLMAGYTHAELQAFMTAAVTPQLAAAEGTTQTIGTTTGLNGWLRIYDQIKDVIAAAQSRGFDVWIITASPQDAIAAIAPMAGVAADHVIGIRSQVDGSNHLTYRFEGCGTVAAGEASMITYIQGKRCWINKVIYGDTAATAMQRRPDGQRQYLSVGDSDTDIEFVRDATYKLVLNRNKKELMCFAYYDEHDAWRINPMFIGPKAAQAAPYPCSTTACKNEQGVSGPCRDDAGNIIPDQLDAVHP